MATEIRPKIGAWERRGGRVRIDAKGRPVCVIRKQVNGRRYEISTRRHTLAAAHAETRNMRPHTRRVFRLVRELLRWSRDEGNVGGGAERRAW